MASLGTFGTKHNPVDLTFDLLDRTFRVNPEASRLALLEWLDEAASMDRDDRIINAMMTMRLMRMTVHPEDFDEFWTLAKAERQTPEEITAIGHAVMEAVSLFPTGQPSGSATGQGPTPPKSTDASPSPAGTSTAAQALAKLRGAPDLQEFVVHAEELREEMQREQAGIR